MVFAYYMNMGVAGFWYGYFVRSTLLASVYYYCIWYVYNWDEIAKEVAEREK
jgi:Na+-driven multidrug efflux pump